MKAHRIWSRRRAIFVVAAIVVCTAVAAGAFLNAYTSLARSAFRDRSLDYARAFASAAGSWLARGQADVAETMASFLATGSVLSVDVLGPDGAVRVHAGRVISERDSGAGDSAHAAWRRVDGESLLDVAVPLPNSGDTLWLAMDTSSVDASVRFAILLSALGGAGFDAAIIGLLVWALRGRRPTKERDEPASKVPDDATIVVGDLAIDSARCSASFAGRPLKLTPKQFALLSVLASDPGRVFSEAEILAAAWPDSAYADARDIKQYIYLLRRRLAEAHPSGREVIVTVAGFGYRLSDGR